MAEPPEAQSFTSSHVQLFVYSFYSRIEYPVSVYEHAIAIASAMHRQCSCQLILIFSISEYISIYVYLWVPMHNKFEVELEVYWNSSRLCPMKRVFSQMEMLGILYLELCNYMAELPGVPILTGVPFCFCTSSECAKTSIPETSALYEVEIHARSPVQACPCARASRASWRKKSM